MSVARVVRRLFAAAIVALPSTGLSQQIDKPTKLDFPLLELPFDVRYGLRAPGMKQSLTITSDYYKGLHYLLETSAPRHRPLMRVVATLADFATISVPFADAWLHEEWHRGVLGQFGVDSHNDVWNITNLFASTISVSHVTDEDLSRIAREHPVDFVRLKSAGMEAEMELTGRLQRDKFFRNSPGWHAALYWIVTAQVAGYVSAITSHPDSIMVDDITHDANLHERTIPVRDISGHDFTSWVYYLFRTGEPLEARGPHPSGVGLNRYISVGELTTDEKLFLKKQGRLVYLNFLNSSFIGIDRFAFTNPMNGRRAEANLWLRHELTSFGHVVDAEAVYRQGETRLALTAHRYTNHERDFHGLQLELVERPITIGGKQYELSPRVALWSQPKNQKFMTTAGALGGLAGVRVESRRDSRLQFYVDAEAKSAGWVAGRVSLDRSATFSTGLTLALPSVWRR